jgi:hypothetical protein
MIDSNSVLQLSIPDWIKGAILGAIIIPFILYGMKYLIRFLRDSLPARKLLEGLAKNEERCIFWLRDAYQQSGSHLLEVSQRGVGSIPNVMKWWAEVDSKAVADVLNVLGSQGKSENIEFHLQSENRNEWDANIVCIGAQFAQADLIFNECENVFYKIDNTNIIDVTKGQNIVMENDYRYGIIIKVKNLHKLKNPGVAFLIGGFGTMGTEAAGYYFRTHFKELGKKFGKKCFGIVVRAKVAAGPQSVERIKEYDRYEQDC